MGLRVFSVFSSFFRLPYLRALEFRASGIDCTDGLGLLGLFRISVESPSQDSTEFRA